jgi:hypothetical protein
VEYVKYHKAVTQIRALAVPKREWKTEVLWFYGPTGTGKSRRAFEMTDEPYVHNMSSGKWFDGYEGQDDVIFDDMRKDTFKFHELLRLFDRYHMKVEVKGASVNWCPKRIIVTTCFKPEQMYETREDLQQLMRRIEQVVHFPASMNNVLGKRKLEEPKRMVHKEGEGEVQVDGASQRAMINGYKPVDPRAKRVAYLETPDYPGSYVEGFVPPKN